MKQIPQNYIVLFGSIVTVILISAIFLGYSSVQHISDEPEKIFVEQIRDSPHEYDANIQCHGNELCLTEKIVKILDGDTIYLDGGYEIRLSLTNTPERHELGFYEASQFTADMCPVGTRVMVDQDDKQAYDVYGRILGKVVCGNKVLNSELLYANHANILTRYCSTSEFSDEKWAQEFGC